MFHNFHSAFRRRHVLSGHLLKNIAKLHGRFCIVLNCYFVASSQTSHLCIEAFLIKTLNWYLNAQGLELTNIRFIVKVLLQSKRHLAKWKQISFLSGKWTWRRGCVGVGVGPWVVGTQWDVLPWRTSRGMSPWVPFKQEELIKADAKVRNAVDSKDGNWPESDASRNVRWVPSFSPFFSIYLCLSPIPTLYLFLYLSIYSH